MWQNIAAVPDIPKWKEVPDVRKVWQWAYMEEGNFEDCNVHLGDSFHIVKDYFDAQFMLY